MGDLWSPPPPNYIWVERPICCIYYADSPIHAGLCGQQSQSVWREIVSMLYCYYYVSWDCWIVSFNARIIRCRENNPESQAGVWRAECIKGTQWAGISMVFGWLKASAIGSRKSPWIPVPASPLIHPPSWLSDWASMMHSQNLLFGIVALCLCLMSLPCMVYTIPLHQFYRYGRRAGDAVLPRNDDGDRKSVV